MDDYFRPIPNYPGYRISLHGEVQSCWTRHARPALMTATWHPLRPIVRPGCLTVNLSVGGEKKQHRIHRLVLLAFVGPPPPGMVACHNDGDPSNNHLANLRWDTPKANTKDALRHGTLGLGSRCGAAKRLGQNQVGMSFAPRPDGPSSPGDRRHGHLPHAR